MSLAERIQKDMVEAMKAKQEVRAAELEAIGKAIEIMADPKASGN